ncbi:Alpha/Beta hydrolase protein [Xylariales sp. PMI_506]|nr:Alpha/Beta hydrolase protein [Xylariales sp. PMI_506]
MHPELQTPELPTQPSTCAQETLEVRPSSELAAQSAASTASTVSSPVKEKSPGATVAVVADLESNRGTEDMPAVKAPWWSRYSGYTRLKVIPTSRTRRAVYAAIVVGCFTLIGVLVGLYRAGRLGSFPSSQDEIKIALPQGTYLGEVTSQSSSYPRAIEAWRGIPYAQSTAGDNRFRPPQALNTTSKSSEIFDARDFGPICSQGLSSGSEDCLSVNVYRPHYGDNTTARKLDWEKLGSENATMPVVIYVHGGSFNSGSGKERNMASFVSWAETPIIGVSFNYRVGALGFLPSQVAKDAGILNLGLKDQQMLFAWVQQNIASFGGDPDNVTLMGLSAGSHSIGHQMISYAPANKLTSDPVPFHKIILESGGSLARATFAPTHPLHEEQFEAFIAQLGLSQWPEDDLLNQLRTLSWAKIQTASNSIFTKYNAKIQWPFQPTIEGPGGVIPDLPLVSWQEGNVVRVPILTGFDTNEGALFVPHSPSVSTALRTLMGTIIPALNDTSLDVMEEIYPDPTNSTAGKLLYPRPQLPRYGKQFWRLDDGYAHYAYICPVLQAAHFASVNNTAPVYVYHFSALSAVRGACEHGDEAPVVAHDMSILATDPGLTEAADAMTGFWTRFAAFGDPNPSTPANETDSTYGTTWEKFVSPFTSGGNVTVDGEGQVALFAYGNDERMKAKGRFLPGVPSQMINLTSRELGECQYWFDRVIYSEGFGNGSLAY